MQTSGSRVVINFNILPSQSLSTTSTGCCTSWQDRQEDCIIPASLADYMFDLASGSIYCIIFTPGHQGPSTESSHLQVRTNHHITLHGNSALNFGALSLALVQNAAWTSLPPLTARDGYLNGRRW